MPISRLARRNVLLQKQRDFIKRHPTKAAARGIVKGIATSSVPGKPLKSATVFYDKPNYQLGQQVAKEFRRKRVNTQEVGLFRDNVGKENRGQVSAIKKAAKKEAVVFIATDKNKPNQPLTKRGKMGLNSFDYIYNDVIESSVKNRKTKRGTKLVTLYSLDRKVQKALTLDRAALVEMRRFTQKTFNAVKGARTIIVSTTDGTRLVFTLSPRIKWAQDKGIVSKNYWGNLPAGEIFTAPLKVNGKVVINGFMDTFGTLQKNPITFLVREGRVVKESVQCKNSFVRKKFMKLITNDKNASRIGELGLGTNAGIKGSSGNILSEEKKLGVHVALGDPIPEDTRARWESGVHTDFVLRKPTVQVGGRIIMKHGKTLLK